MRYHEMSLFSSKKKKPQNVPSHFASLVLGAELNQDNTGHEKFASKPQFSILCSRNDAFYVRIERGRTHAHMHYSDKLDHVPKAMLIK